MGNINFCSGDASLFFKLLEQLVEQGYIYLLVSHDVANLLVLLGRSAGSFNLVSKDKNYFTTLLELDHTSSMVKHDQLDIYTLYLETLGEVWICFVSNISTLCNCLCWAILFWWSCTTNWNYNCWKVAFCGAVTYVMAISCSSSSFLDGSRYVNLFGRHDHSGILLSFEGSLQNLNIFSDLEL